MIDPKEGMAASQVWAIAIVFGLVSAVGNLLKRWGKFSTTEEALGSFLGSLIAACIGGCSVWVALDPVHPGVIIIATAASGWLGEVTTRTRWEQWLLRLAALVGKINSGEDDNANH